MAITIQGIPSSWKGRADRNDMYEIRCTTDYNNRPSNGLNEQQIKSLIRVIYRVAILDEEDQNRKWYDVYFRSIVNVSIGVWHVHVFQEWLD